MKWTWKLFFLFPAFISLSFAQVGLRTAPSIVIESGFPQGTNIIADDQGFVYLEMTQNVLVQKRDASQARFDGEILPPTIIGPEEKFYEKKPRGRTRSIVAFEIASDTLESLKFLDYFKQIPQSSRARIAANLDNPADLEQRTRLMIPLFQKYNQPVLWEYLGVDEEESRYYKEEWERVGGVLEETPEEDIDLFTVNISGTGVYVLFDEDPDPSEEDIFIPYEEIELAPEAPYQSVSPRVPSGTIDIAPEFTIDPTDPNQIPYPTGEVNIPTFEIGNEDTSTPTNLLIQPTQNFTVPPTINPLQAGTYNPNAVNTTFGIPNGTSTLTNGGLSSFAPPPLNVEDIPPITNGSTTLEDPETSSEASFQPSVSGETSPTPSATQKQKVESLIQDRLLQGNTLAAPSLEPETSSNPQIAPPETNTGSTDPLLVEKKQTPQSIQDTLKANSFSDPLPEEEPDFYPAADKPLPKTGTQILFGGSLSVILLLSFGYYWFSIRNKKPKQMSLKIKK